MYHGKPIKKRARARQEDRAKTQTNNSGSLPYRKVKLRRLRITLRYSKRCRGTLFAILFGQRKRIGGARKQEKF